LKKINSFSKKSAKTFEIPIFLEKQSKNFLNIEDFS